MKTSARIRNSQGSHEVTLSTNGQSHPIRIPPKETVPGSSANGGELLSLALATCYCNDIYREAEKLGIRVAWVEVEADSDFGGAGEPARNIKYRARVAAHADHEAIEALMRQTDRVAEIQNTLRLGIPVVLEEIEAMPV
jgi:organic hydroperoxide reductase OsmC/OhrA